MGSGKKLVNSINKNGIENFEKEILFIFDNEDEMNKKEAELVTEEFCQRDDTYNLCVGGCGGWSFINREGKNLRTGMKHSDVSKQKMSEVLRGRISPNKGKNHSDETKEKIGKSNAKSLKGRKLSEEHKQRIAESIRNKSKDKQKF